MRMIVPLKFFLKIASEIATSIRFYDSMGVECDNLKKTHKSIKNVIDNYQFYAEKVKL